MDTRIAEEVRRRAQYGCEYCQVTQSAYLNPFQIDHIIARKHGGGSEINNLALSCFHCNLHKGPNVAGVDPDTRAISRLFHPRTDRWDDHFIMTGSGVIAATTAVGRATLAVLNMNDPDAVAVRAMLIAREDIRATC
jgi:hypothetical protein